MNIYKINLICILMASLCGGALVQKEIGFNYYRNGQIGIDLSKNETIERPDSECPEIPPSPTGAICVTGCGPSDIYFNETAVWDDFVNGCSGHQLSLLSNDAIKQLKRLSAIDFSKPLVLSDTSLFFEVPLRRPAACSTWVVDCPYFENPCPPREWSLPSPPWYIGKTKEGNYFIFRFVDRKTIRDSISRVDHDRIAISYFIQTDGSLNFKDMTVAVKNSTKQEDGSHTMTGRRFVKRFGMPNGAFPGDRIYDLRGRLVNALSNGTKRMDHGPMVYIVKEMDMKGE